MHIRARLRFYSLVTNTPPVALPGISLPGLDGVSFPCLPGIILPGVGLIG